jgi:hypothetical protein
MSGTFQAQLPTSVWRPRSYRRPTPMILAGNGQVKTCWMAKARALIEIAHVHWRARVVIGTTARLRR